MGVFYLYLCKEFPINHTKNLNLRRLVKPRDSFKGSQRQESISQVTLKRYYSMRKMDAGFYENILKWESEFIGDILQIFIFNMPTFGIILMLFCNFVLNLVVIWPIFKNDGQDFSTLEHQIKKIRTGY